MREELREDSIPCREKLFQSENTKIVENCLIISLKNTVAMYCRLITLNRGLCGKPAFYNMEAHLCSWHASCQSQ